MQHTVLCVDDEPHNLDTLERLLRKKYKVLRAENGLDGLILLKDNDVSVIISDQRMPQMQGVEFLAQSIEFSPNTIRFLLTGYTDVESLVGAINKGQIYKYLTKPWDPTDLINSVDKAVETLELKKELEIKNKKLNIAVDELKSLDKAKSQFMYLVNHELKTPLTSLISFSDFLSESKLDDEQTNCLKHIKKSTKKLHKIIDDVLMVVSCETNQMELNKAKLTLSDLDLKELTNTYRSKLEEKKSSFKFCEPSNEDKKNVSLSADKNKLHIILQRLIENAVEFCEKDSDIFISTNKYNSSEDKESKHSLEVTISNKALSINKEQIKAILKPFSLNENMMNHSKGFGLGLSVVQSLLKAHDSHLNISYDKGFFTASFLI